MANIRGKIAQKQVARGSEGDMKYPRLTRDGSLATIDWRQVLAFEGNCYMMQIGAEDAPVDGTTAIDDTLVYGVIDVPSGAVAIPLWAQAVVGTWGSSVLLNYMIEIDNAKERYSSGGTKWTPLNIHTGTANSSRCTCYVGADVTTSAKTSSGSLELYRESIEVNVGDAADYWPKMEYNPKICPVVEGPGSIVMHLGSNTGDVGAYANIIWAELDSDSV